MYLKSIEIQGFKSFANKIRLEFHNGFTAIVGPNGSGKSNVGDAVRWVLGEQRVKQLRGGSMQDVIFSGTELRKPLSSCYVAITLDNSDHKLPVGYDEVTVARRLYRSGESEYLINGVQVRLRDVQEMFYDTGIGKEGYSIIGQGQIEKILSDRPEDRRELFDEAAGIVKFKRRKEASLKKLDSEKANLLRINDILSELEKQVGPLEKQAQKARIYLDTREQLKRYDVNIFLMENAQLTSDMDSTSRDLANAQAELDQATQKFEDSKASYLKVQEELAGLEQKIEDARNQVTNASVVRKKLEGDIKVYEEQIRSAQSNAEHFTSRRETVTQEIGQKTEERDGVLISRANIDDEIAQLTREREDAQSELKSVQERARALDDAIEQKRSGLMDNLNSRAGIRARQAALAARKEQYEVRKSELTGRLVQASSDEEEHDREIERLKAVFEQIVNETADLNDRAKDIEAQIAGKKEELTRSDEALHEAEIEYHRHKSRLDALVNMTERYEGFGGAIRRVMQEKDHNPGVIGVVADLIKTEPKYETAIETALGGSIQNIVADNEETVKHLIGILKSEKCGKATFLPLTAIRSPQPFNMNGALAERGVIGTADTLVKTAPEYADVARNLLGRTLIVDSYDHAKDISRKYHQRIRMVTLEGELFNAGGSISGGAFRNSSNLLGRRREIAELEKRVRECREHQEELEEGIQSIKDARNVLRAKLETIRVDLQSKSIEQNTARLNIENEQERKKESSEGYDSLRAENEAIEQTKADLGKEEAAIEKELKQSDLFEQNTNEELKNLQEQQKAVQADVSAKSDTVSRWDIEIEKQRQKQTFENQELSRIDAELERLKSELNELLQSLRSGTGDISEKQAKIEETKKTIEASIRAKEESEQLLARANDHREELNRQQAQFLNDRDRLSGEKADLDKEVYRLQAKKEKVQDLLEEKINYMWAEYEITLSQAAQLRDPDMTDLPAMKKQSSSLKDTIRSLGSVNVNAIGEYQQVSERYSFMKNQHDDIVRATESLEQIITELDTKMRRQFRTQFARIQEEFDRVFKELFGGGSGRLELMEGEDILEAGVRVIAQPPGKKLVNMMQMSGGEKSLTAISLLFAIQNLKPSPFCLLDEIEAALDESNVERFANYIHKLTKNTQFIVITHRRGTMDAADRLYGITMQEKGVSTLVSVSLIDEEDIAS